MVLEVSEIEKRGAYLDIPHNGDVIRFGNKLHGPDLHEKVMESIDERGLLRPSLAQTVSLIYEAVQHRQEPRYKDILGVFNWGPNVDQKTPHFTSSTEMVSVPGQGIYVSENLEGSKNRKRLVQFNELSFESSKPSKPSTHDFIYYKNLDGFLSDPYVFAQVTEDSIDPLMKIILEMDIKKFRAISAHDFSKLNRWHSAIAISRDKTEIAIGGSPKVDEENNKGYAFGIISG